jgi:hypothetical protein
VTVEYRWAEGQYDRVPVIALELVGRQVAVIVANTPGVLALKLVHVHDVETGGMKTLVAGQLVVYELGPARWPLKGCQSSLL